MGIHYHLRGAAAIKPGLKKKNEVVVCNNYYFDERSIAILQCPAIMMITKSQVHLKSGSGGMCTGRRRDREG